MTFTTTSGHRVLLALGTAAVLLVPLAAPAQGAEIHLETRLHPTVSFAYARGHAGYEAEEGHRELEATVAGVRALHGRRVVVRVHGTRVGSMTVNRHGRAHLERHTSVRAAAGDVVALRTRSGRLVASGTFHRHTG